MNTVTVRLDEDTKRILLSSKIEGNRLTLPGQLPRPDYVKVAKAIEAAGGKWNRKEECHIFPADVRETILTADTVSIVDQQQTFQSFYTPPGVASQMMVAADLCAGMKVLEPSAGSGNLIKAMLPYGIFQADVTAVEIDERRRLDLARCGEIIIADFLTVPVRAEFDRVIMNPPFNRGQDVKHILHAAKFLADGGRLVALCANGATQRSALESDCCLWEPLPPNSFKESGTGVNVAMVMIEK